MTTDSAPAPAAATPTNSELVDALQLTVARVRAHFAAVTASIGVTPAQAKAVRQLEQPVTLSDLAARLGADVSNTSSVVKSLETQGLLRRETHEGDRRARLLTLTEEGVRVRERLAAAAFDNAPPFDTLSSEQRRQLYDLLRRTSRPQTSA